ncbi:hypothetical protein AS96_12795 [Microbacterium sp. MRS-1]|uniref:Uncharacterized protein n=1 Tax=Candidatus Microsaccharimonas sossegonensis TaxID=2506948 RepID=A0A4Q0AH75_9BACT|nr:hypothetical protein [Microbacterium sp. MRS-1]EXJ50789.1 hypothetical protein AS96_12795 [Microbacterium sp. MRS-1]RWZ78521.1 MAG: hypothetical protein EOT05_02090 [Candidatus Microsaccharimonas sossegonensis]
MASFSQGDKVESVVKITGGMFSPDVPAGSKGVVLSSNWSGSSCRVHFTVSGMFSDTEVDVDVNPEYLKKRW